MKNTSLSLDDTFLEDRIRVSKSAVIIISAYSYNIINKGFMSYGHICGNEAEK